VADSNGYTYSFTYSLTVGQPPTSYVAPADRPGVTTVSIPVPAASVSMTNTTSGNRQAPGIGNLVDFTEFFKASEPICAVTNLDTTVSLDSIQTSVPHGTYCYLDVWEEDAPGSGEPYNANTPYPYQGTSPARGQTDMNAPNGAALLMSVNQSDYSKVAADLAAGPTAYALTTGTNFGGKGFETSCNTAANNTLVILVSKPAITCSQ
jgi:hypothetical protein